MEHDVFWRSGSAFWSRVRPVLSAVSVASLMLLPLAQQAVAQYNEYEVKAAFLWNFTQFVKWPAWVFPDPNAPFSIGIIGEDPFGNALRRVAQDQTVGGRKIVIRRSRRPDELRNCPVVFISKSEQARLGEILAGFQGTGVLTVGDMDGFCTQGGAIGFVTEGDKVRFEINSAVAQRAGLEVSSRLMKVARNVQ